MGTNNYEGKPFALLLPAYTANKSYWKEFATEIEGKSEFISSSGSDSGSGSGSGSGGNALLYVLPPDSYQYRHPEGTGKDAPPFYSAWFLGGFKSVQPAASTVSGSGSGSGLRAMAVAGSNMTSM